jgi:8-oxo-dGTP diphosphatase
MTSSGGRKVTEVAVGVLIRADRAVLLADRPAGKAYAGYWEFPGGKVEPGETVAAALARELREELGVSIGPSMPWIAFEFDYPHAYVRLHFERVYEWQGEPHAREGQRLAFHRLNERAPAPLLPAAVPALRWLRLPEVLQLQDGRVDLGPVIAAQDLRSTQARPDAEWVGASVEAPEDFACVAKLQCDFALVGPVFVDPRYPERRPLGWEGFARFTRVTPVPVFAFGGLALADLDAARRQGAHGIASSVLLR